MVTASLRRVPLSVWVGVLVLLLVGLVGAFRPTVYEARVSLLATPVTRPVDQPAQTQYGSIVGLGLPALSEIVRSPSVLRQAAPGIGREDLDALAAAVSVELVPSSAVARITVRSADPGTASAVAASIADSAVRADLLAPVARLRPLDPAPAVQTTSAPLPWLLGLSVAAGLAAGVVTSMVRRLAGRRYVGESSVRSLLSEAGLDGAVAVLGSTDDGLTERLAVLQEAASGPVRVVAASASLFSRVGQLQDALAPPDARVRGPEDSPDGRVVLCVDGARTRAAEFMSVVHALPEGSTVVAVVVFSAHPPGPVPEAGARHGRTRESAPVQSGGP